MGSSGALNLTTGGTISGNLVVSGNLTVTGTVTTPVIDRWLTPVHSGIATTSQTFTVARVILAQFAVERPCTCDGMTYVVGAASVGNVIGGIVGPIVRTADTALAAPVVAQSASTAQGSANTAQTLTWAAVPLAAGLYYVALQGSDVTGTYMRLGNQVQAPGLVQFYDRGGGFGALTDPTPAVTDTGSACPGMRIRLA